MRAHEKPNPSCQLAELMLEQHNLVALTFVQRPWLVDQKDFTVYVNKHETVCVERAAFDLLEWHKVSDACGFSVQSLRRLEPLRVPSLEETIENVLERSLTDRPTWEDFEIQLCAKERVNGIFRLCLASGYVYPSELVTEDALKAFDLQHQLQS